MLHGVDGLDCPRRRRARRGRRFRRRYPVRRASGANGVSGTAFELPQSIILSIQNTDLCYKKSSGAVLLYRRKLPEGHFPGAIATSAGRATSCRWDSWPAPSGSCPGPRRPWSRRWPSRGWSSTSRTRASGSRRPGERLAALVVAAAPADRAVPGEGDGHELDRGPRRSGTPRARGVGSADRPDRRDARPPGGRSARRSDPRPGRCGRAAPARHAPDAVR